LVVRTVKVIFTLLLLSTKEQHIYNHHYRTFRYHCNYTNAMTSDENQQLSVEDLIEIEECEKIVGFGEAVM
jgi:hypothetical protein